MRLQLAVRRRRLSGNRDNEVRGNQLSNGADGWPPTQLFPNCIDVRTRWHTIARTSHRERQLSLLSSKRPRNSSNFEFPTSESGPRWREVALNASRVLSRLMVISQGERTAR